MKGRLYIVPTPVGNLGDFTFRAVDILKASGLILAEDTRTSAVLLKHYGIDKPLKSYHQHNEHKVVSELVKRLEEGIDIALVSDAGTPGISDPGFLLVREAVKEGIEVITLPGATALVPALVNSGFPINEFSFYGFLPQKKGRQKKLAQLAGEDKTFVLYESPYRLVRLIGELIAHLGENRHASVSREISKVYEETRRGSLRELEGYFSRGTVRGEIVLVVQGNKESTGEETA